MRRHACEGCAFCEHEAEARADDLEPTFDESGAADQYERQYLG